MRGSKRTLGFEVKLKRGTILGKGMTGVQKQQKILSLYILIRNISSDLNM